MAKTVTRLNEGIKKNDIDLEHDGIRDGAESPDGGGPVAVLLPGHILHNEVGGKRKRVEQLVEFHQVTSY